MSPWYVAVLLLGVIGSVGCRSDEASSSSPPESPPTVTTVPPPPSPVTTEPQPPPTQPPPATVTNAPKPEAPRDTERPTVESFAVYVLSRGKGVPPEAQEALRQVVALAKEDERRGVKVTIATKRMGLEGEKRVCIDYEDPKEGARAYARAADIVKGVDLVNLEIEPCAETPAETPAETNEEKES